jgi:hypothetical protein
MCLLFVTTAVIFFVAGAAFRSFDQDGEPSQVLAAPVIPAQTNPPQVIVIVPATGTATSLPTVRPTNAATVVPGLNWCGTATPGATCEVPPYPTGTATPYPDCAEMASIAPGSLCQWQ